MNDDILPWLRLADSDLASAKMLTEGGEYFNALFHLQQAAEKTLKALFIKRQSAMPPRLHDLHKLADKCGLTLAREQGILLDDLTRSYASSRYPDTWGQREDDITAEEIGHLTARTREFLTWVKSQI
jgi:HEPN domain-containing protein